MEMPLQSTGCYPSLCNSWCQTLPGTQSNFSAELSIGEQTASLDTMQLRVHPEAVHPALYTDTELPTSTNPTSCCFLFKSHHVSQLAHFFKLFFAPYLWLWTSLLWFWCNVANPPQLQACLKITAFHRVWFRVRKRNVALSWCGCQDRILLMYAVI
jgi:hypothetical protein